MLCAVNVSHDVECVLGKNVSTSISIHVNVQQDLMMALSGVDAAINLTFRYILQGDTIGV